MGFIRHGVLCPPMAKVPATLLLSLALVCSITKNEVLGISMGSNSCLLGVRENGWENEKHRGKWIFLGV